jgi:hypothetical protein
MKIQRAYQMRIIFLMTIALCFSLNTLSAQIFNLGSQNILYVKYNIDEKIKSFW